MKNSELRSLLPAQKKKPKNSGLGTTVFLGGLVFILAAGGLALYRNPDLAHGWIPGFGKSKPAVVAAAAPTPAQLPVAARSAIADAVAASKDEQLTMLDEQLALSAKVAGEMMTPEGNAKRKAEIQQAIAEGTSHIGGVMKVAELLSGRPNIMTVKLYFGGKTSHAMADSCLQSSQSSGRALNNSAEAMARFTSCYLTTNVERLCSAAQKQVLAEVIDHYYATRDFWIRKADDAAHGGIPLKPSNPRPADWTNPAAKGLAASLGRLVAQGYVTRSNFGWFPEEELKTVLNATAVERDVCAGQRS